MEDHYVKFSSSALTNQCNENVNNLHYLIIILLKCCEHCCAAAVDSFAVLFCHPFNRFAAMRGFSNVIYANLLFKDYRTLHHII